MNKQILGLVVIVIFGLFLTQSLFHVFDQGGDARKSVMNSGGSLLSFNGIVLNTENAPNLSDLFPNNDAGPHQKFISKESCLKCHAVGVEIPGIGKAPQIIHEPQQFCTSCHLLPE